MDEELNVFPEGGAEDSPEETQGDSVGTVRVLIAGRRAQDVAIYGGDTVDRVLDRVDAPLQVNVFVNGEEATGDAFVESGMTLSVFGSAKGG